MHKLGDKGDRKGCPKQLQNIFESTCTHFRHPTDEQLQHRYIFLATTVICSLSALNSTYFTSCHVVSN